MSDDNPTYEFIEPGPPWTDRDIDEFGEHVWHGCKFIVCLGDDGWIGRLEEVYLNEVSLVTTQVQCGALQFDRMSEANKQALKYHGWVQPYWYQQ